MVILSTIAALLLLILFAFLRYADRGFLVSRCFPYKPMKTGDKVHIYINYMYNRSATITKVSGNLLYIYGTLPLGINYRGRFYARGTLRDGERLLIVPQYKYSYLAILAEAARKLFGSPECIENLPTDEAAAPVTEESNEKEEDSENEADR